MILDSKTLEIPGRLDGKEGKVKYKFDRVFEENST